MSKKFLERFLRGTIILLIIVAAVLVATKNFSPIYGLGPKEDGEYFIRFPIPLPFLVELLTAPLLSFWIVVMYEIDKQDKKLEGWGMTIDIFFFVLSLIASIIAVRALQLGVFFGILVATIGVSLVIASIIAFVVGVARVVSWWFS